MKKTKALNATYSEALDLLAADDVDGAINVLHGDLLDHPRAAQTLYLFGVSHMLAGNTDFGFSCVDKAYALKPWVRDDLTVIPGAVPLVTSAQPTDSRHKEWVEYMKLRLYPLNFGLGYDAVIGMLLQESPVLSFVEIGANDGKSADPIFKYVQDGRLQGLLIEPMPDPFERLQAMHANTTGNTFLNLGVGKTDGELELFYSARSTLTTANPEKNALKGVSDLEKVTVPVKSLVNILADHKLTGFDILQIDTEGYEWEILQDFPLTDYDINIIFVEFYCLSITERVGLFRKLLDANFSYFFDGTNLLAVKTDQFPALSFGFREGLF